MTEAHHSPGGPAPLALHQALTQRLHQAFSESCSHWLPKVRGRSWAVCLWLQKPRALDTRFWLLCLPEPQFPCLSSGLRDERCCSATTGWTILALGHCQVLFFFFFFVGPGLGPRKLKRSKATCPSRPACHRRGLMGQVSYLHSLSFTPTMIILLLLAQCRPCCGFRSVVIYSQWKLGPPPMVLSYPLASISLHPTGRPLTNFCGPRKCSKGPFLSREDSARSLG